MWFEQKSSEYYQNINKAWIVDDIFAKIANGKYHIPTNLKEELSVFFLTRADFDKPVTYTYHCDEQRGTSVSENKLQFRILIKDNSGKTLDTLEKELFHEKHPMLV